MTGQELRQKYLDYFKSKDHAVISPAPLVPQEDPTTLFTGSGMQPLVPYLLGQKHPQGTRLVNSQPSFRAEDIDEIGDDRHTTFFEMLGNWSLGDYFKAQQLSWFWDFLIQEIKLSPERLYVSVFSGSPQNNIPKDEESASIWKNLFSDIGIKAVTQDGEEAKSSSLKKNARIFFYDAQKNWWSRQGVPENMPPQEPGGPDSEVFFEFDQVEHDSKYGPHCHPNCDCGRFFEIGNSVFMQYKKNKDGTFEKLKHPNVDFGGGLERLLAVKQDTPDMFKTDLFQPIINKLKKLTDKEYEPNNKTDFQAITDHIKAATFMIGQGVRPSNKQQGYVLRRLLRNASMSMYHLTDNPASKQLASLVETVVDIYKQDYDYLETKKTVIKDTIDSELNKFSKTLEKGLRELKKMKFSKIDEQKAFDLYQSHGLPFEITSNLLARKGVNLNKKKFEKLIQRHAEKSRSASKGMFKGGLADHSETTMKYHTATHLVHKALRKVLGKQVKQTGSNITQERLRFDFTYSQKLSDEELREVEKIVNKKIDEDLQVEFSQMTLGEALEKNALAFFKERYNQQEVKVYSIGDFSLEVCNGPHVSSTGDIGHIKIYKQTSVGKGIQRIYAKLV